LLVNRRKGPEVTSSVLEDQEQKGEVRSEASSANAPPLAAPGSLRTMNAQVESLWCWLGKHIVPPGGGGAMKASVMALVAGTPGRPPRHNKYSGIQEWRNAVLLFVNVRGKAGSLYPNLFLKGGNHMTWFAQPSQTIHSPVIERMLVRDPHQQVERSENDIDSNGGSVSQSTCPVLLFCRQEGEPYVFCGQLRASDVQANVRPLKVLWELTHISTLKQCQAFIQLVGI